MHSGARTTTSSGIAVGFPDRKEQRLRIALRPPPILTFTKIALIASRPTAGIGGAATWHPGAVANRARTCSGVVSGRLASRCHRGALADVAWRTSYDGHLVVKHNHIGFSSASSRFSVSPVGVRRTDPTQQARADSLCLIEAGRRRTRSVATQPRRRSGQTASAPPARPASSPRNGAPTQHSRGVSPRCINDGPAPMQAFNVQGAVSCQHVLHERFCDGLHRRHHISKMSTRFSTAILLHEPAAALATR
jgi:hypothetical protein